MLFAVEAMKHLHVLIAHEQRLCQSTLDGVEERLTIVEIYLGGTLSVALFNLHRNLKISIYFFHFSNLFGL